MAYWKYDEETKRDVWVSDEQHAAEAQLGEVTALPSAHKSPTLAKWEREEQGRRDQADLERKAFEAQVEAKLREEAERERLDEAVDRARMGGRI